jgi:hypothetical protein
LKFVRLRDVAHRQRAGTDIHAGRPRQIIPGDLDTARFGVGLRLRVDHCSREHVLVEPARRTLVAGVGKELVFDANRDR